MKTLLWRKSFKTSAVSDKLNMQKEHVSCIFQIQKFEENITESRLRRNLNTSMTKNGIVVNCLTICIKQQSKMKYSKAGAKKQNEIRLHSNILKQLNPRICYRCHQISRFLLLISVLYLKSIRNWTSQAEHLKRNSIFNCFDCNRAWICDPEVSKWAAWPIWKQTH